MAIRFTLMVTASLVLCGTASANDLEGPLQFEDVFSLEMAASPQISPDGDHIVYIRRSNDIMTDRTRPALWVIDYDGSDHRPIASGSASYSGATWSPDSEAIVAVASEDGETSLIKFWPSTGRQARLAELPFGAGNLSWSPDGHWIAFTMFTPGLGPQVDIGMPTPPPGAEWAEPSIVDETTRYEFDGVGEIPDGGSQIYIISAEGGAPQRLTSAADGNISGLEWHPNSEEIFYSWGGREADGFDFRKSDIWAVSRFGQERQITDFPGPEGSPTISPDGQTLAYLGEEERYESNVDANLYVMDIDGGEPRRLLADLDRGIDQIEWNGDSALWVRFDDRGRTVLARTTLGGNLDRVTDALGGTTFGRPYTSGSFSASDNGRWAATLASPYDLADVGAGNRRGGRELTDLNADVLGRAELAEIMEVSWESSADGREIQGWLALPPGYSGQGDERLPLILEIHGGPHTAYGPQFSGEVQLMAAAGYAVLYTNPRGSTSYGEEFANLIDKAYPGNDVDDLLSGVDHVIEMGIADEDRLFVTGGSGGGVLTAQLIGVTDRFAAAAVGKPVINWTSFTLAADIGPAIMPYWFGVTPWDEPEEYWRRSPLSLVGNVETPSLVFVGAEDRRTPVFESEQYYNALQIRGIDSRLVRIPGTYHGIADSRPSRLLQKVGHILAWFEEYDPANMEESD